MSKLADFLGGSGGGSSGEVNGYQLLGDFNGTVQLDLSQYNKFEGSATGAASLEFVNLPTDSRVEGWISLLHAGTSDISFGSNVTESVEFDGFFTETLSGWDLSLFSYNSDHLSATGQGHALYFKPDGTVMYRVNGSKDVVETWILSVPWTVSSGALDSSTTIPGNVLPTGIFFRDDGLQMYLSDDIGDVIQAFDLSVAWDVTTLNTTPIGSVNISTSGLFDFYISPDGVYLFIVGRTVNTIDRYSMSIPWDISTATADGNSLDVSMTAPFPSGVFLSTSGDKLYVAGTEGSDAVVEYNLATPWDLQTASQNNSLDISNMFTTTGGIFFESSGNFLAIVGISPAFVRIYSSESATPLDLIKFTQIDDTTVSVSNKHYAIQVESQPV